MYMINFYVPESHLEAVKTALFEAGAGQLGNYDSCAWQTQGEGQYRPRDGSQPFIGQTGKVEHLKEYKVEIVCKDELIKAAIKALKEAHPYETPAYQAWKFEI